MSATIDELRDLFTGVPAEDGEWASTPSYTVPLALEIAKRTDASSEYLLKQVLYDNSTQETIPVDAIEVIRVASQRYQQLRNEALGARSAV